MIIAMDGPAASGKGTLAKQLAHHYSLEHLDTGALYRAVARDMIASGKALDDEGAAEQTARNIDHDSLDDPVLRTPEIGEAAAVVAGLKGVRKALVEYQRTFAAKKEGALIEGRDIGTVVLPDADLKVYLDASIKERARRRYADFLAAGLRRVGRRDHPAQETRHRGGLAGFLERQRLGGQGPVSLPPGLDEADRGQGQADDQCSRDDAARADGRAVTPHELA